MSGALSKITVKAHSAMFLLLQPSLPHTTRGLVFKQLWSCPRAVHLSLLLLGKQTKSLCLPVAERIIFAGASWDLPSTREFHYKSIKRHSERKPCTRGAIANHIQMCRRTTCLWRIKWELKSPNESILSFQLPWEVRQAANFSGP